jgi:hypothetical protein
MPIKSAPEARLHCCRHRTVAMVNEIFPSGLDPESFAELMVSKA